ncbi:MAG: hypothetical protein ACOX3A_09590 [bacterium]|jgi:hypothetical protein
MSCLSCGNCQQGEVLYYCPDRNEFIIDEALMQHKEKVKTGWKKGEQGYEFRRKQNRREPKTG